MVSVDTVFCTSTRIQTDSYIIQGDRVDLACNASRWREGLFRGFVGNELELRWRQLQHFHEISLCRIKLTDQKKPLPLMLPTCG
jgi:hypothetical protein